MWHITERSKRTIFARSNHKTIFSVRRIEKENKHQKERGFTNVTNSKREFKNGSTHCIPEWNEWDLLTEHSNECYFGSIRLLTVAFKRKWAISRLTNEMGHLHSNKDRRGLSSLARLTKEQSVHVSSWTSTIIERIAQTKAREQMQE